MLSDSKGFSKEHGWLAGMGDRTGRYAMIIEKDGKISYAENEQSPVNVEVSVRASKFHNPLLTANAGLQR